MFSHEEVSKSVSCIQYYTEGFRAKDHLEGKQKQCYYSRQVLKKAETHLKVQ